MIYQCVIYDLLSALLCRALSVLVVATTGVFSVVNWMGGDSEVI